MSKQIVITISGPSGSGKTTLERNIVSTFGFRRVISTTTRAPRIGEKDGEHYRFVTKAQFREMSSRHEFVEVTEFDGEFYGVAKRELMEWGDEIVVIVCDPKGAHSIKLWGDDQGVKVLSVFLDNTKEVLVQRMIERDRSMDSVKLASRLLNLIENEVRWKREYDHLWDYVFVMNEDTLIGVVHSVVGAAMLESAS